MAVSAADPEMPIVSYSQASPRVGQTFVGIVAVWPSPAAQPTADVRFSCSAGFVRLKGRLRSIPAEMSAFPSDVPVAWVCAWKIPERSRGAQFRASWSSTLVLPESAGTRRAVHADGVVGVWTIRR